MKHFTLRGRMTFRLRATTHGQKKEILHVRTVLSKPVQG
jgi:hypothetical protein